MNKTTFLIDKPTNGWSHLVSNNIPELHKFAQAIGVNKCWFENKRGKNQPHYDIKAVHFNKAIENGVIVVERKEIILFLRKNFGGGS